LEFGTAFTVINFVFIFITKTSCLFGFFFRIYFPSEFIEPPPEISPEVDTAAGWGCVLS
jgi:hypothetical protein